MKRQRRTAIEIRQIIAHLNYEVTMFVGAAEIMSRGVYEVGSCERNALLESFTIHARNLLDFLYSPNNLKPDDVAADDFFLETGHWSKIRPPKSALLDNVHRRVGKEVAHLTYARLLVTEEAKLWQFVQIAEQVLQVYNFFVQHVESDQRTRSPSSSEAIV